MIKAALKRVVPRKVRIWRYKLGEKLELGELWRSAPMREFGDYDDYWQKRGRLKTIFRRWRIAAEVAPLNATLLDVGCGSGEFLEFLKTERPDIQAEGTDFSSEAVEMTTGLGLKARRLDLATEKIEGEYDVVTSFEVLEHLPEAERGLRTLRQAFRKQLLISIPNVGYIGCRLRLALFGRFPITMCRMHIKEHLRHWTERDFREWVAAENLRVIRVEGQYGPDWLPWKLFPGLFAKGLVYIVEHGSRP